DDDCRLGRAGQGVDSDAVRVAVRRDDVDSFHEFGTSCGGGRRAALDGELVDGPAGHRRVAIDVARDAADAADVGVLVDSEPGVCPAGMTDGSAIAGDPERHVLVGPLVRAKY